MKPIERILIIGGGSAGWMTAAYLSAKQPALKITLIESADIPTVSVGESTNPVTRQFHQIMKLDEQAFMRSCNATYKIAIRFEDFLRTGHSFYHPFGKPFFDDIRFRSNADSFYLTSLMSDKNKFDKKLHTYAYQLDAALYGEFLKKMAVGNQVTHKVQTITDVVYDENGFIQSVEGLDADLYIDCTGFRSILFKGIGANDFIPLTDYLLNDRAVVMNVPYRDPDVEMRTYTNCKALSAGWLWDIPLWNRRSAGYVYSSKFLTEEQAEEEFRRHLGFERVKDIASRQIKIRQGRFKTPWFKNCVAIGLSSGFIEPLESTGLSLTALSIMNLELLLNDPAKYNHIANELFDCTADFILAHFVLTQREDSEYWRFIKQEVPLKTSLDTILRRVANKDFSLIESNKNSFYKAENWNAILSGMGLFSDRLVSDGVSASPYNRTVENWAIEHDIENSLTTYQVLKNFVHV